MYEEGSVGATGGPYPAAMERMEAASKPRVLLANEPRSYRRAMAHVLRALRPDLEVAETEQAAIDRQLRRSVPQLVICSRATPALRGSAPAWIELYTDNGPLSSVAIGKERSMVPEIELVDILLIVDWVLSS